MSLAKMDIIHFKETLSQMQKNLECAICLELLNNPVSTKCDHQFCRFCITKLLQSKRSMPCPLCKVPVTKRGLQERSELSVVVNNLKKLIAAFETDTGEKYSPSKGEQTVFPSSPQDLKRKSKRGKKRKSSDQDSKKLKMSCSDAEDENSAIFYRSPPSPCGSARSMSASRSLRSGSNKPSQEEMKLKTNKLLRNSLGDTRQYDFCTSPEQRTARNEQLGKCSDPGGGDVKYTKSKSKTRSRSTSIPCVGSNITDKSHSTPAAHKSAMELEKYDKDEQNASRSTRGRSRTRSRMDYSFSGDGIVGMKVSGANNPDGEETSELNGKQKDKRSAKNESESKIQDNQSCKNDCFVLKYCEEGQQSKIKGQSKNCRGQVGDTSQNMDKLLQYLEKGSCGAALEIPLHEDGDENLFLAYNNERKGNKNTFKHATPIEQDHDIVRQLDTIVDNHDLDITDSASDKKSTLRSSKSRVPLSSLKAEFSNSCTKQAQKMSPRKPNRPQTCQENQSVKPKNSVDSSSSPSLLKNGRIPNSVRTEVASPASEVSSVSSTQQLMKPKPPVSRTYSKEMQNAFHAESFSRNWVDTLPQPYVGKEEGENKMKQLRGLTIKEKIDAKKRVTKRGQSLISDSERRVALVDPNPAQKQESLNLKCDINRGPSGIESSIDDQFELPLTPKPTRKYIFKSRLQDVNDQQCIAEREKVQEELTNSQDPYKFVGQTPVKSKSKMIDQKKASKKGGGKRKGKSKPTELFKVPLDVTGVDSGSALSVAKTADEGLNLLSHISAEHVEKQQTSEGERKPSLRTGKTKSVHFASNEALKNDMTTDVESSRDVDEEEVSLLTDTESVHAGAIEDSMVHHQVPKVTPGKDTQDSTIKIHEKQASLCDIESISDKDNEASFSIGKDVLPERRLKENDQLSNDTCTKQPGTGGKKGKNKRGKSKFPVEENHAIFEENVPHIGKVDMAVPKKKLARRRNKKTLSSDGETFSQKSGREMVKLMHKINDAEDYELMFSTQEAQQKILEEQARENDYEEAFGFSMLESESSLMEGPSDWQDKEEEKTGKEVVNISDDEEGKKPLPGIRTFSQKEQRYDKKASQHLQEGTQDEVVKSVLARETLDTEDRNNQDKSKVTEESVKRPVMQNEKQIQACSQIKMSDAMLTPVFKHSPFTKTGVNGKPFENTRKDRAQYFSRPNFSKMIQVSPGPKGIFPVQNSGTHVDALLETSYMGTSLLKKIKHSTDVKPYEDGNRLESNAEQVGNRVYVVEKSKRLLSPDGELCQKPASDYRDTNHLHSTHHKIESNADVTLPVTPSIETLTNSGPLSQSPGGIIPPSAITETSEESASVLSNARSGQRLSDIKNTQHASPAKLSLKSKDPIKLPITSSGTENTGFTSNDLNQTILVADTCVDDDYRGENLIYREHGTVEVEAGRVVSETMDMDAESHHHETITKKATCVCPANIDVTLRVDVPANTDTSKPEIVAETQLGSLQSTQSPGSVIQNSVRKESMAMPNSVTQQSKDRTDTVIPDSCIVISSDVSERDKITCPQTTLNGVPQETQTSSSLPSQSILQNKHLRRSERRNSSHSANHGMKDVAHHSFHAPSCGSDSSSDNTETNISTTEMCQRIDKIHHEESGVTGSTISPKLSVDNTTCSDHAVKKFKERSTLKRKYSKSNNRESLVSRHQKTPISKISAGNQVSSAPSRLNFSDSEDEDSVLIVRRSKRKCLSLDGSPLKPVIFTQSKQKPCVTEEVDNGEMIGETEALEVLDTWTEQNMEDDKSEAPIDQMEENCESPQNHKTIAEVDGTELDEGHGSDKKLTPSRGRKSESIGHDEPLVEVTPIGKLKYIDSSGRYVVDLDDTGSQGEISSKTSQSSPVKRQTESAEKRKENLSRHYQESLVDDLGWVETAQVAENEHISGAVRIYDSDQAESTYQIIPKDGLDETTSDKNVDKCDTNNRSETTQVEETANASEGNLDASSLSGKKGRTKRGLASKRMALNLEFLPKHPKGSLSPASKAAILQSVEKPETTSENSPKPNQGSSAVNDAADIIDVDAEDDLAGNVAKPGQPQPPDCNDSIASHTSQDKERNATNPKSQHPPENFACTDTAESCTRNRQHRSIPTSASKRRKSNESDDLKKKLERELFGQEPVEEADADPMGHGKSSKRSRRAAASNRDKASNPHCAGTDLSDESDIEMVSFDLGVSFDDEAKSGDECGHEEHAMPNKSILEGETSVATKTSRDPSGGQPEHNLSADNEKELEDDMKSSSSVPLTSSPCEEAREITDQESIDQSLIAAVGETDSDRGDDDDGEDHVGVGTKRKMKRQQIASDSEDSGKEDDQERSPGNYTSSSALSSQSETLTTQQQEALEGDLAKLHKEIAKYEAKLGKQSSSSASSSGNIQVDEDVKEASDNEHKKVPSGKPDASSTAVTTTVISDDDEDSNDLFLSPASPSPPQRSSTTKISLRKPVPRDAKRQADLCMKQFQSPGGSVRTKQSLEFTVSNSVRSIRTGQSSSKADSNHTYDKTTTTSRFDDVIDVKSSIEERDSTRPVSPVILSQKTKQSQLSQEAEMVDGTKAEAGHGKKENHPEKDLCLVGSGLGRDENLMVLRLVERHSAKFSPKFINDVTHVIMKPAIGHERVCDRTLKFFQGVAHRCWVVTYSWVTDSLRAGHLLPEEDYEIVGDTSGGECTNGVRHARISEGQLFSEFCFACVGSSQEMPKESLCDLLTTCGAVTVDDPIGLLSKVAKYKFIVRCSDSDDAPTPAELDMFNGLYKHLGLLTLMREWILDSLGSYTLLPLVEYVLNTCEDIQVPF